MGKVENINSVFKKKIYINDTFQVTVGRLTFVLIITTLQFFGFWLQNDWVIQPSMFFLFANALLALSKSTKPIEEKIKTLENNNEELKNKNRIAFMELNKELYKLKKDFKEYKKNRNK